MAATLRYLVWSSTLLSLARASPFGVSFIPSATNMGETLCGGDSTLHPCGMGFPNSFCCPMNTKCTPVNGTSFVSTICCLDGLSCDRIETISCDIDLQNAILTPASQIHTLNLTEALPTCNGQCCPFGYACQDNFCVAVANPPASSSASTTMSLTLAPTSTSSSTMMTMTTTSMSTQTSSTSTSMSTTMSTQMSSTSTTTTATLAAVSTTMDPAMVAMKTSAFDLRKFLAGFIVTLLVVSAAIAGAFFYYRRRRRQEREANGPSNPKPAPVAAAAAPEQQERRTTRFSMARSVARSSFARRFTRNISEPMVHPQYGNRTDFNRAPSMADRQSTMTTVTTMTNFLNPNRGPNGSRDDNDNAPLLSGPSRDDYGRYVSSPTAPPMPALPPNAALGPRPRMMSLFPPMQFRRPFERASGAPTDDPFDPRASRGTIRVGFQTPRLVPLSRFSRHATSIFRPYGALGSKPLGGGN